MGEAGHGERGGNAMFFDRPVAGGGGGGGGGRIFLKSPKLFDSDIDRYGTDFWPRCCEELKRLA